MNVDAIKEKMEKYYATATPEQILKEFQNLGVEFVQIELTPEQNQSIIEMNIACTAFSVGMLVKFFLEEELGLTHDICVKYRKGLLKQLDDRFKETQSKADSLGAIKILYEKLKYEKNFNS